MKFFIIYLVALALTQRNLAKYLRKRHERNDQNDKNKIFNPFTNTTFDTITELNNFNNTTKNIPGSDQEQKLLFFISSMNEIKKNILTTITQRNKSQDIQKLDSGLSKYSDNLGEITVAPLKSVGEITCYSCSGDQSDQKNCFFVDANTPTCSTIYGCLYIIEPGRKVTRHCFVPMPEHEIISINQVCEKIHQVYYECGSCLGDFCNDKIQDRYSPVKFGRRSNVLNEVLKLNLTEDEDDDRSNGVILVAAPYLPSLLILVQIN